MCVGVEFNIYFIDGCVNDFIKINNLLFLSLNN